MKTSRNETQTIELYLKNRQSLEERLVFDAHCLLDPELQDKVQWQQQCYELIQASGRRQLKNELEALHQQLLRQPEHRSFMARILKLF